MFVAPGSSPERLAALILSVAASVSLPVSVKADFGSLDQLGPILEAGAARVVLQSAALGDPDLISAAAGAFSADRIAVEIEALRQDDHWRVRLGAADDLTEWDPETWARVVEAQGGGELIVGSAVPGAFGEPLDLELLRAVTSAVGVPVVAKGEGVGVEDLFDALMIGGAEGVLVGDALHSARYSVRDIKKYLSQHGLPVDFSD